MFIVIVLRFYLSRENKRRDKLAAEGRVADTGFVESEAADGSHITRAVDNNQLDLTDRENLEL